MSTPCRLPYPSIQKQRTSINQQRQTKLGCKLARPDGGSIDAHTKRIARTGTDSVETPIKLTKIQNPENYEEKEERKTTKGRKRNKENRTGKHTASDLI